MDVYIGKGIKVKSDGIIYQGFVKSVDSKQQKIVLKNIKDISNGKQIRNEMHFFGDQIEELEILEDVKEEANDRDDHQHQIHDKVEKYTKHTTFMDASDKGPSLFQMGHLKPSLYINGVDNESESLSLNEPPKAVVIDKFDSVFFEAITKIYNQKVISLVADGCTISRFGEISLLTIGTRQMVYLFDLHSLGGAAFEKGLHSIIENPNILKIVHDVRMVSDCLYAKYYAKPINIFDTQVADAFVHKNENGRFPETVSSLTDCIVKHLRLDENDVTFEYDKKRLVQSHRNIWTNRPLNSDLQKVSAKNAMYLRELRVIMLEKLLADFLHGVNIYLKSVREESDNTVKYIHKKNDKLPKEFKSFVNEKDSRGKFQTLNRRKNDSQYKDSDSEISYNDTSRSVWDSGTKFSDQYQEKHGELVEKLGDSYSMIDHSKPLLRQTNSPKSEPGESQRASKVTPSSSSTPKDVKLAVSNSKSHVRKFHASAGGRDDFHFSGTSDSDDSFLVSGNKEEYDADEIERLMKLELGNTNKNKAAPPKRISAEGKRMIRNSLGSSGNRQYNANPSYLSTSPASSVDTNEYPSIQESIQANNPRSKKTVQNINNSFGSYSPTAANPPKSRGRGQILKSLTEQNPRFNSSPGFSEIGNSRVTLGDRSNGTYDFPSDEELMETPHVIPAVNGAGMVGQNVSVLKRFNK